MNTVPLSAKYLVLFFSMLFVNASIAKPPDCEVELSVAVTDMDFGSFVGGTTGTIVMDTAGAMVHTGVAPASGTAGIPATFDLTTSNRCKNKDVTFSMPSSITISNISGSPSTTLIVNNLVSDLPTNPFRVINVPKIRIGGTLNISTTGSAQAPYTGPFDVIFVIP